MAWAGPCTGWPRPHSGAVSIAQLSSGACCAFPACVPQSLRPHDMHSKLGSSAQLCTALVGHVAGSLSPSSMFCPGDANVTALHTPPHLVNDIPCTC